MGVALEPEVYYEPDLQKDLEQQITKRKLIPPVVAADNATKRKPRRDTAQKLARLHSESSPITIKPNPVASFIMRFDSVFTKLVFGLMNYIDRFI